MNKRTYFFSLAIIIILTVACAGIFQNGIVYAQADGKKAAKKKVLFDDWYEVFLYGKKSAYEHTVIYKSEYKGKEAYLMESFRLSDITIQDNRQTTEYKTVTYYTKDFFPLYSREERKEFSQVKITEMELIGNRLHFATTLAGNKQTKVIDYEKGAVVNVNGFLLNQLGLLKPGVKKSFRVVSLSRGKIITETIRVIGVEKLRCMGDEINTFKIISTNINYTSFKIFLLSGN